MKNKCKNANLSVLLADIPESFYWVGFLLADGSFVNNRLKIVVSIKDKDQIKKFGNFIQFTGKYYEDDHSFGLSIMDTIIISEICKKFDIKPRKTYNPPDTFKNFNLELQYCLLAGFIDGDGNIQNYHNRKDCFLRIKNHKSWVNILTELGNLIKNDPVVKVNKAGYAELLVSGTVVLQNLKKRVLSLNIPILKRKWDKIDLNFVDKYTKAEILRRKVITLYRNNYRNKDISLLCNTSPANITKIIKNYNGN